MISLNIDDCITIIIVVVSLCDYSVHVATQYSHISLQIIVYYKIQVHVVTYIHIVTSDFCDIGHRKFSCRAALTGTLTNLYGAVTYRIQVAAVVMLNKQVIIGDRSTATEVITLEGGK